MVILIFILHYFICGQQRKNHSNLGGFQKQLELKKFKLFFLCIMHKEEGEENDKPRVVQSKQKEIM